MQKSRNIIWLFTALLFWGLWSISKTNAQTLELIGSCALTGEPARLAVEGSYAYIEGEDPLLQIVDISNPLAPSIVGTYDENVVISWNLCVDNGIVFIASGWDGILIIDASVPSSPVLVEDYVISDYFHDVIVRKNIAYLLACFHLYIVDISVLSNPVAMGDTSTYLVDGWNFFIEGDYAYIPDTIDRGMTIVNISDPYHPIITTCYDGIDYGYDVSIVQHYAFIPKHLGLQIINIADPLNPFLENVFGPIVSSFRIYCGNNYAFLPDDVENIGGIRVLDISNPVDPQLVFFYNDYAYQDVYLSDDFLYAIRTSDRLDVFRFGEPTNIDDLNNAPIRIRYLACSPNPFNSSTIISFTINDPGEVNLSVYNIQGQRIAELFRGIREAGEHSVVWDASDYPSGVYFARLEAGGSSKTAKMVLLK